MQRHWRVPCLTLLLGVTGYAGNVTAAQAPTVGHAARVPTETKAASAREPRAPQDTRAWRDEVRWKHVIDNDFDTKVAPLLARRCLDCHNTSAKKGGLDLTAAKTALAGGDSGKVLAPGKPDESYLWQRIAGDEMPPKHPLPAEEKAILKAWITAGAKWGSDPVDPFRYTTDSRAGYDWWALQRLVEGRRRRVETADPSSPSTLHSPPSTKNPVDEFIGSELHATGLQPSPPADRRTLIRRLSFDLLGLPPAPEDVAAFVADERPDAYERLVDRLLASPHYGERWARHWLDVARFGESQGFERDKIRPHAWRYRDWVVDAFNSDMPYDEFARLQIAGDVLWPGNPQAIVATGFLVAGPFDEVGQNQQSEAMKAVVRQDELEDLVSVVGQTFLGLTINCARCHDHKFDPVKQEEYYRLTAALAGVRQGERSISNPATEREAQAMAAIYQARVDDLNRQLTAIEEPARDAILAERTKRQQARRMPPEPIARWEFDVDLQDAVGTMHGKATGKAEIRQGRLHVDGRSGYVATAAIPKNIREKTLEAWVNLPNLGQRGGGVISLQTHDGEEFDAIVFGEREPARWLAGSDRFRRTEDFAGPAETEADDQFVHMAITYADHGTITAYRNGRPYGKPYKSDGPVTFQAGEAQVLFGLRHMPAGGNRLLAGVIESAALYDRALTAHEVATSAGVLSDQVSEQELLAKLTDAQESKRERLKFEADQLREHVERAKTMNVYAVTPKPPPETHFLIRGNTAQRGDVVTAGGVAAVRGTDADFDLPADASDERRRTALAQWITDEHNPLFARVIVNRLWHYHFGVGLVDTPNDFGFNGGRPTHPELIDWLAGELIRHDWSLKAIQRLIVTSATYRQVSRTRPEAAQVDAQNRLLWRKTPLRLEAESVRDAVLSIAGELNPTIGGPGYYDFTTYIRNTQFYDMVDPVGETFNRRSLYRTWIRSGRSNFLDVFDCPDPSTKTPNRAVTTTPLQALSLMNNEFVLRMAERFAERVEAEAGTDASRQVGRVYELAYGRTPSEVERQMLTEFVRKHGLAALCRVVLNSNEFLYVD